MATAPSFRLTRYFTLASLVAFAIVAAALYILERSESRFIERVQREQAAFFAKVQADFIAQQQAAARRNLLTEHEAGHLTLARVLANATWERHFARPPYDIARADAAVNALMRGTAVFKVKVYDLKGMTVYSSERAQIGEDKSGNVGWAAAVRGRPATELVHRDRFSAFEGEVENRDLVQSYIPVVGADGKVMGVFEIYSDVTALLAKIQAISGQFAAIAADNQGKLEAGARENESKVASSTALHFAILAGLLALLYLTLWLLVRNAQRILDGQQQAREQAALREQQWHHEKMAALATMAANASHEIGNPLAVIAAVAGDLGAPGEPILEQVSRIAQMNRRITEFASARSERPEPIDVNAMVKSVCDFFAFDERYRAARLDMRLAESLPACMGIPDYLNEVLMTLLQAHAETQLAASTGGGRLFIQTEARAASVLVSVGASDLAADDPRVESARRRMAAMGGALEIEGRATRIGLPCLAP